MVFSSIMFIFRFLPIMFIIYYLTPNKFKNLSLLILSLVFYSWGEPKYFIIINKLVKLAFIHRSRLFNKYFY